MAIGRNEMNREEAQPRGEGQELAGGVPAPLRGPTRVNAIFGRLKRTLRWRRSERTDVEASTRRQELHWRMREELWNELTRSRRYGRSFLLLRIRLTGAAAPARVRRPRRPVDKTDSGLEQGVFRRTDRVWVDEDEFYVLLPECDRRKGDAVVSRVRALLVESLGEAEIAMAAFPDDGVTSGALLVALRSRSSHWQVGRESDQPEFPLAAGEVAAGNSSSLADAMSVRQVLARPNVEPTNQRPKRGAEETESATG